MVMQINSVHTRFNEKLGREVLNCFNVAMLLGIRYCKKTKLFQLTKLLMQTTYSMCTHRLEFSSHVQFLLMIFLQLTKKYLKLMGLNLVLFLSDSNDMIIYDLCVDENGKLVK